MAEPVSVRTQAQVRFSDDGGELGTLSFRDSIKWRQRVVEEGASFGARHPGQLVTIEDGVRYEQGATVVTFTTLGDPTNFVNWLKHLRLIDATPALNERAEVFLSPPPGASPQEVDANYGREVGTREAAAKDWSNSSYPARVGPELDAESARDQFESTQSLDAEPSAAQHWVPGMRQRSARPEVNEEGQPFPVSECQLIEDVSHEGISDAVPFILQPPMEIEEYTEIFVESVEKGFIVEIGGSPFCLVLEDPHEPDSDQLKEASARSQLDGRAMYVDDSHVTSAD